MTAGKKVLVIDDNSTNLFILKNQLHGDEDKCIKAGINDYIGKPVKLEEVVAKLEKWALHTMAG